MLAREVYRYGARRQPLVHIPPQLTADKLENMEVDSIISAIQGGKADIGVAGMTVTEDRKKNVDFSDTYYTGRQVIIVKE